MTRGGVRSLEVVMGLCSGKLGDGRPGDVLGSTAWAREVLTGYQKKRRGISQLVPLTSYFKGNILGITKFCNFSFEPIGSSCDGQEERHKISIGFLNAKSQPQTVNWILILGVRTPQSESVGSEIKVRTTFITDLQTFLSSSSYKRAKFLLNIPELVYHEERVLGKIKKLFLVLENIEITKKCKPSPPYLVQVRML